MKIQDVKENLDAIKSNFYPLVPLYTRSYATGWWDEGVSPRTSRLGNIREYNQGIDCVFAHGQRMRSDKMVHYDYLYRDFEKTRFF